MVELGDIDYFWSGIARCGRRWRLGPEAHPFHEILVIVRGRLGLKMNGESHEAGIGDALFYPAGMAHEEWSLGDERLESLVIQFFWRGFEGSRPPLVHDRLGRMQALASWLAADHDSNSILFPLVRHNTLELLATEYVRLTLCKDTSLVERTRAHIHMHMTEPLTLEGLANLNNLSKYHFLRLYRKLTGESPMSDVRRIRLERARHLALRTELPLKAIAERVGIAHAQHLSLLMRRHFNVSIQEMRTGLRESGE